uniref:Uncharacterized protein n=1 Tax=Echeneis naucrates TaxID=173247 RepID=A0A665UZ41_ECHNA
PRYEKISAEVRRANHKVFCLHAGMLLPSSLQLKLPAHLEDSQSGCICDFYITATSNGHLHVFTDKGQMPSCFPSSSAALCSIITCSLRSVRVNSVPGEYNELVDE